MPGVVTAPSTRTLRAGYSVTSTLTEGFTRKSFPSSVSIDDCSSRVVLPLASCGPMSGRTT